MIYHIAQFFLLLFTGTGFYFILNYIMKYVINWHITHYPQWSGMPQVGFMMAIANWGLFILLLFPAFLYLFTNTRRPER